jgi:diguanylate cyclase (GGDEF)-like protein
MIQSFIYAYMSIITEYFTLGTRMKKDELISLIDKMHQELIASVQEQKHATQEQVYNYLLESAQIIKDIDESDDDVSHNGFAESLFHNAYKDIAKQSLESYASTNANIEKLVSMHEETFNECAGEQIDLPSLTEKFDAIQQHMTDEVKKANDVISLLTNKVKNLEEKSNLDSLTRVFNRHALTNYLNKICSNPQIPYSFHLLMLDIDDFKHINDTYGHIAGDKVLIFLSNTIKKTLRDGDKIFRYGGEEFIIILNRIDDEQCVKVTNRLLGLIQKNKLIYKGKNINITISVGATKYKKGDTHDSLISRADKALYRAKENGKNQMFSEV